MNPKFSGGSIVYAVNLISELSKLDKNNNYTLYLNKNSMNLQFNFGPNFKCKIIPFSNSNIIIRYFWEQLIFPFILLIDNLDLIHSLGYVGPIICPTKHVVSILDLNYKYHGASMNRLKRVLLGSMINLSAYFSTKIITISHSSKNQICKDLNVKTDKIIVTHLSGSKDVQIDDSHKINVKKIYKLFSEFIIAFGSPSSHKNIKGLVLAFSEISLINKDINLLLVGHQEKNNELHNLISKLNLQDRIHFTGFVPDKHVFPLISESKLFVFPSFYEGFGIPILDAQFLGIPVASSNSASLPEIGSDGALYFDPKNTKEMSSVITKILNDDDLSRLLVNKGFNNRLNYSWSKTAKETLKCYNSLV